MKRLVTAVLFLISTGTLAQAQNIQFCPQSGASIITSATYTLQTTDFCNWLILTYPGEVTVNLPYPALPFDPSFFATLFSSGGSIKLVPQRDQYTGNPPPPVNGAATVSYAPGISTQVKVGNDSHWYSMQTGDITSPGGGSPAIVNTISAGNSNTLSSLPGLDTVQNWTSTAAGARTQNIPACNAAIVGYLISIKDAAGVGLASTYNIYPAAGTIEQAAAATLPSAAFASVTYACDGVSNWMALANVGAAVSGFVTQLGAVTPGHIATWAGDGQIQDGGGGGGGGGGTATINTISSGTSNTLASLVNTDTIQNWTSITAGAHTQNIPACASGISGYSVTVKDTAGVALTSGYTIAPASGTVDLVSSITLNSQVKASKTLICDGVSNWIVR